MRDRNTDIYYQLQSWGDVTVPTTPPMPTGLAWKTEVTYGYLF